MWLTKSKQLNRLKTTLLTLSLPALLFLITRIYYSVESVGMTTGYATYQTLSLMTIILPILIIRFIIAFLIQRKLIFKFSWAKPLTRKENPEIYNIVENLCISRWLPTPQIWIMEDDSMNAFATGRQQKKSRIVFSRWLINKLNRKEIEAVAWHELTHIINKDVLLMAVIITFVWIIWTLWEILIRGSWRIKSSKDSWNAGLAIIWVWIWLMILGYLLYPLIRLAISRKREFLADAWSVELTKDKFAMISALQKIEKDSTIESIKKHTVATMCIETPFAKKEKSSRRRKIRMTHPSISERVEALQNY